MINKNNLETIKKLADKIEYTVIKIDKEARISPIYDEGGFDTYKEDLFCLLSEVESDVISIENRNTRDYYNLFTNKNKQYYNDININRLNLTVKEKKIIDNVYIDSYDGLVIETTKDITDSQYLLLKNKIEKAIYNERVTARGYSQGDWEEYNIIYYKDITKEKKETLDRIIKNISYMFTVQEYYINLVDIETRLYTSGIEETEEVETDGYSFLSYDGYTDIQEEYKKLKEDGYKIIDKN